MPSSLLHSVFDFPTPLGCLIIFAKTIVVYIFLVGGLRLLGKRELGQMNVYDLVMVVVIGNAVQNAMMNNDNSLGGGIVAAFTLLALNRVLNYVIRKSKRIERLMVGEPLLLVSGGKMIAANMAKEGITEDQLEVALREHGMEKITDATLMVLEVDGSISVVPTSSAVMTTRRHYKAVRLP